MTREGRLLVVLQMLLPGRTRHGRCRIGIRVVTITQFIQVRAPRHFPVQEHVPKVM